MTRRVTATTAILMLALALCADLVTTPPNPYAAPAIIALGSGISAAGGFYGALPD